MFSEYIYLQFYRFQANCDRVTDLKRFQGKSEPTWMFIHVSIP